MRRSHSEVRKVILQYKVGEVILSSRRGHKNWGSYSGVIRIRGFEGHTYGSVVTQGHNSGLRVRTQRSEGHRREGSHLEAAPICRGSLSGSRSYTRVGRSQCLDYSEVCGGYTQGLGRQCLGHTQGMEEVKVLGSHTRDRGYSALVNLGDRWVTMLWSNSGRWGHNSWSHTPGVDGSHLVLGHTHDSRIY